MRLYRFTDESCEKIEPVTVDDLDLTRKTLFIFPGMEVEKPQCAGDRYHWREYHFSSAYAAPESRGTVSGVSPELQRENEGRKKHLSRLLERGVVLGQGRGFDVKQVVVAAYDDRDDNAANLNSLLSNPDFVGSEAEPFMESLYYKKPGDYTQRRAMNPENITFLGWSYGSTFIQQCGNRMRIPDMAPDKRKIHAMCVASIISVEWVMNHGFPGLYMYGLNDKTLPKYISTYHKDLMNLVNVTHQKKIPKDEVPVLIPENRHDQVITISNMPDTVNRFRNMPKGKRTANGSTSATDPRFPNPECHAPAAFMEAYKGSTFTEEFKGGMKLTHDAYRHTRLFQHAAEEILTRKEGESPDWSSMLGIPNLTIPEADHVLQNKGFHVKGLPGPVIEFVKRPYRDTGVMLDHAVMGAKMNTWETFVHRHPSRGSEDQGVG